MFRFRRTWEAPGFVTIPKEGPPKLIFFLKEITELAAVGGGKKARCACEAVQDATARATPRSATCQKARCQFTQMDLRNRDNLGNHHGRQDTVSPQQWVGGDGHENTRGGKRFSTLTVKSPPRRKTYRRLPTTLQSSSRLHERYSGRPHEGIFHTSL